MGIVRKIVAAVAVAGALALPLSAVASDNAGGRIGGGTTVSTAGQGNWPQKG